MSRSFLREQLEDPTNDNGAPGSYVIAISVHGRAIEDFRFIVYVNGDWEEDWEDEGRDVDEDTRRLIRNATQLRLAIHNDRNTKNRIICAIIEQIHRNDTTDSSAVGQVLSTEQFGVPVLGHAVGMSGGDKDNSCPKMPDDEDSSSPKMPDDKADGENHPDNKGKDDGGDGGDDKDDEDGQGGGGRGGRGGRVSSKSSQSVVDRGMTLVNHAPGFTVNIFECSGCCSSRNRNKKKKGGKGGGGKRSKGGECLFTCLALVIALACFFFTVEHVCL